MTFYWILLHKVISIFIEINPFFSRTLGRSFQQEIEVEEIALKGMLDQLNDFQY